MMAASATATLTHPDPDITAKLRHLQSRVQVWVKPTDRILTDADAYEYDCYRAERTSDRISFHWGCLLALFASLSGAVTYYACLLLVSGRVNVYLQPPAFSTDGDGRGGGKYIYAGEGVMLGELVSVLAFHMAVFPAVAAVLGNRRVRVAAVVVVGYCLLAMAMAGVWWWVMFSASTGAGAGAGVGEKESMMMCLRVKPFGVGVVPVGGVHYAPAHGTGDAAHFAGMTSTS